MTGVDETSSLRGDRGTTSAFSIPSSTKLSKNVISRVHAHVRHTQEPKNVLIVMYWTVMSIDILYFFRESEKSWNFSKFRFIFTCKSTVTTTSKYQYMSAFQANNAWRLAICSKRWSFPLHVLTSRTTNPALGVFPTYYLCTTQQQFNNKPKPKAELSNSEKGVDESKNKRKHNSQYYCIVLLGK